MATLLQVSDSSIRNLLFDRRLVIVLQVYNITLGNLTYSITDAAARSPRSVGKHLDFLLRSKETSFRAIRCRLLEVGA